MADESLYVEAFNALRDPKSDPDGMGQNFCLTTAEINGVRRWAITAVFRRPDGTELQMPLFFGLVPGVDKARVHGQEQRVVETTDFQKEKWSG